MKKRNLIYLSLLSGLIMVISWINVMMLGFLMLVAFVPLLYIEDYIANNTFDKKFSSTAAFVYSYPAFFLFTFCNTWWISNASVMGYVVSVIEAAFMSIVFQCYSYSKKIASNKKGAYFFLIFYWIAFEYIQFQWDLNFPWLNLGNSFAQYPFLIQWYSVLGMEGGTLWILLSNILIYFFIISLCQNKVAFQKINHSKEFTNHSKEFRRMPSYFQKNKYGIFALAILCIPTVWSVFLWFGYKDEYSQKANVVIIQPNLDPYKEQYVLTPDEVISRVEYLAKPLLSDSTDFLVLPESCVQEYAWEERINYVPSVLELQRIIVNSKNCEVIAGLSSRKMLLPNEKSVAARQYDANPSLYYESYNTAIKIPQLFSRNNMQLRHKSILVVGVEKLPFKKYLPFVEKLALNMGGTVGSLGTDSSAINFYSENKQIKVGVPICWESIDGNYTRMFVKNGADFLQIITNVGWWGDTPGYKQYFAISRLRAIENRRYVSICANTGFSGLVNAKGVVLDKGKYWQREAFVYDIPLLKGQSFFAKHGDMIMKPFTFFAVLLFAFSIVKSRTSKDKKNKIKQKFYIKIIKFFVHLPQNYKNEYLK